RRGGAQQSGRRDGRIGRATQPAGRDPRLHARRVEDEPEARYRSRVKTAGHASALRKALVLAAGRGSRMRAPADGVVLDTAQAAAAGAGLKCMMPIGGRPFLDYVLHALADAGIDDVALVLSPVQDEPRDYYRR